MVRRIDRIRRPAFALALIFACAVSVSVASGASAPADLVKYDFETGDLQGWKVIRGSFPCVVCDRSFQYNTRKPLNRGGRWFLSTLDKPNQTPSDAPTGRIESPVIRLTAPTVTLRVAGGRGAAFQVIDRASFKVLASTCGDDNEVFALRQLKLPVGRDLFFRVVDFSTGGWGHILLDDVEFRGTVGAADFDQRIEPAEAAAFDRAEQAIAALGTQYRDYPAAERLAALRALKEKRAGAQELDAFMRRTLLAENPAFAAAEIVYVNRAQFARDHHNTATIFQCGEINHDSYRTEGALRALDMRTGRVRDIVPKLPGRTVRDPEVDYDGRRIVFSMRNGRTDNYHIYDVLADGTGLRQLTRGKGVSDIDPVYLPEGGIVFSSTRNPKYCMCNRHIMANLYRMDADGANIHQIGVSTLFEGHSTLLADGRILYDRWEYVDRNFGDAQGLWVCNQDGTHHAIYWGNNTTSPGAAINARQLPNGRVIAVFGSCHDRPWGALGLLDRTKGVDGRESVVRTWPREFRDRVHEDGEDFDSARSIRRKYADPYPIDNTQFLAVRQNGRGDETALVYLDLFGHEFVICEEPPGIHSPVLLRAANPAPKRQSVQRNFAAPHAPGRFLLQDVYVGTHMKGVKRGSIKALRVIESPEKRNWTGPKGWTGHGEMAPAMNWHSFENKRILGTVPVEEDGSAYFELPANTFVYFQALDAEGKMVQSMRSGAYVQPGETYGCVGCHESRVALAPPAAKTVKAAQREPSKLDGAYNLRGLERGTPPHFYSFRREVQPVFDRACVKCHDYGRSAGGKLNLSGDLGAYFCTSYVDLWAKRYVTCIGGGPAQIQNAYSWGAHASKLTKTLFGHGGVTLTADERDRIITWMDLNAPYYPQYESAYPGNPGGRCPLTFQETDRLSRLAGRHISNNHRHRQLEQLNFTRPELSRILDAKAFARNPAAKAEALAILREGAARLRARPRADMPNFVPCDKDRTRDAFYREREKEEARIYETIRSGRRAYDPD